MTDVAIKVENLSKLYPSTALKTGLRDALVSAVRGPLQRLRRNS